MYLKKKNLSSSAILMQIIVIFVLIEKGYAIKCYICNSRLQPDCANIKKTSAIQSQTCELHKMNESNSWLNGLNRITYMTNAQMEVAMRCQKMIAREDGGDKITIRFCQLHTKDTDACSIPKENAKEHNIDILECVVCNKDNCNGTIKLEFSKLLFGFIILILFISK